MNTSRSVFAFNGVSALRPPVTCGHRTTVIRSNLTVTPSFLHSEFMSPKEQNFGGSRLGIYTSKRYYKQASFCEMYFQTFLSLHLYSTRIRAGFVFQSNFLLHPVFSAEKDLNPVAKGAWRYTSIPYKDSRAITARTHTHTLTNARTHVHTYTRTHSPTHTPHTHAQVTCLNYVYSDHSPSSETVRISLHQSWRQQYNRSQWFSYCRRSVTFLDDSNTYVELLSQLVECLACC